MRSFRLWDAVLLLNSFKMLKGQAKRKSSAPEFSKWSAMWMGNGLNLTKSAGDGFGL
jgi:hypothetical protein